MRGNYLQACPAYFGAKRAVVPQILAAAARVLPRAEWSSATWVEPFLGGGSTALAAKRVGFRVVSNDIAERSRIVGHGLLVNDRVKLSEADELRLHAGHPTNDGRLEREFAPKWLMPGHARWLDGALAAARAVPDATRRNLLLLLLIEAIGLIRPFGDWSRTAPTTAFAKGDYDAVRLSVGALQRIVKLTPHTLISGLRDRVNAGVFSNGRDGHEIHGLDALDFVSATSGDLLYLDSPYAGSSSYEATYEGLDMILEGRSEARPTSVFNTPDALAALDRLLEAGAATRAWVISFGGGQITHTELLARVRRHRPAELAPIAIKYRVGTAVFGESGADREILIVARKGA